MAAFTAVAAGVGLAITAVTTAVSFAQMAEEDQKKKKAEEAAAKAMMAARKKLDVNYYEQLGVQKEPYELARRELLVQGAMATEALREGDPRALAAGVGRVQLAQQGGQEKVAIGMQQEKSQLDKLVAGEDSRLRDLQTQLDLQEVVGAQQAMSDAERASQMAMQQGMAGLTSMAGQVSSMPSLYGKSDSVKAANRANKRMGGNLQAEVGQIDPSTLPVKPSKPIPDMSQPEFDDWKGKIKPSWWDKLYPGGGSNTPEGTFPAFKPPKLYPDTPYNPTPPVYDPTHPGYTPPAYDPKNPFGIITYF